MQAEVLTLRKSEAAIETGVSVAEREVASLPTPLISVVMTIYNRAHLLRRTLEAFVDQNFGYLNWELVIVDDASEDPLVDLLNSFRGDIRIRHVVMHKSLSKILVKANCPALGLNIGFRKARGYWIYKTDPEVMPITDTLQQAFEGARNDIALYGQVHWVPEMVQKLMEEREITPGMAKAASTKIVGPGQETPFYFIGVFPRDLIMAIGGIDERYLSGVAGEDDDFALRIQIAGAKWTWDHRMEGLHQYHGPWWHQLPGRGIGDELHMHNLNLLRDLGKRLGEQVYPMDHTPRVYPGSLEERVEKVRVNRDHEWGSFDAVIADRLLEEEPRASSDQEA